MEVKSQEFGGHDIGGCENFITNIPIKDSNHTMTSMDNLLMHNLSSKNQPRSLLQNFVIDSAASVIQSTSYFVQAMDMKCQIVGVS